MSDKILALLSMLFLAFLIYLDNGFTTLGGWLCFLIPCIFFAILAYFDFAEKRSYASRLETFLATSFKWISRLLSGMLILLLSGWTLYSVYKAWQGGNVFDVLFFALFGMSFTGFLIHFFLYGQAGCAIFRIIWHEFYRISDTFLLVWTSRR
ncbi:hypothetical protein [Kingella kingae]|uniref:Uncharacterized protein n=2 Tax=Kingella kingae TaxID=504 RepID=F5S4Z9_KINKI|nr:hypothetical protein [Kingella kingae]EGK11599.1 hypothetical protein HMPREF0476_0282 [Kingella kingae ATCC 23330]UOP03519.1 hypothetical protein LVJ79_02925 [Kingella kingae]SQH24733.1 Uncharacterised protein [Kingella kingae]